jgi:hypothetical protein
MEQDDRERSRMMGYLPDKVFYVCDCGCSAVAVDDAIWEDIGGGYLIGISLWRIGMPGVNWRARWSHIKHILRHGHPYTDTTLLALEQAQELGEHLLKLAEKGAG